MISWLQRAHLKAQRLFSQKKGLWRAMALGFVALTFFVAPSAANAGSCGLSDPVSCIAMIFIWIFQILTALMGYILIMEVDALIRVAQYFNFVSPGPTAVRIGWIVTRDLANMFFIVFLLIIAFGTVIGSAKYHYEKNLKNLLIMAVVINFSKTICGLMIDMSQVLMLSFVNGFKAAAAGNFLNAFQISKLLQLADGAHDYNFGLVLAMLLAFILAAIAASVVLIMLVMMAFRVVMLWVLIILSPIAFLTSAIPGGGSYYSQWWGELKKYLIGGPVIAFFLWLALASAQATTGTLSQETFSADGKQVKFWGEQTNASRAEVDGAVSQNNIGIPSEAGRTDTILSMVIVTCILFAGLKFASDPSISGLASGFAGMVSGKVHGGLKRLAMAPYSAAVGVGSSVYGAASSRTKQGAYGVLGSLATRIPGLNRITGGLGAAALAKEEEMKKKRRASLEKFTGTEAQKAEFMKGGTYAARVAAMKDPEKQMQALKLAMANPKAREALFAAKEGAGGETYTQAGLAMASVLEKGGEKDFLEMTDLAMSDKNMSKALKEDPEMLSRYRTRLKGMAEKNPNQAKKAGEFDQKFVAQLAKTAAVDKDGKPVLDERGAPKKVFGDDDLKKLVPKMAADDVGGLDKDSIKLLAPYMTDAQFAKALDATSDPDKAVALMEGTQVALDNATRAKDDSKIAEAAKRAIHSGALTADTLKKDREEGGTLSRVLGSRADVGGLVRGIDRSSEPQRAAVGEVMRSIMKNNPERARTLRRQEQYQEFMPPLAEFEANDAALRKPQEDERTAKRDAYVEEAASGALAQSVSGRVNQLRGVGADDQAEKLMGLYKKVQDETVNLQKTRASLKTAEDSIANAGNMAAGQLNDLKGAAETLKKRVEELKNNVAKAAAEVKGEKFDDGKGGAKKNNRTRNA